MAVLGRLDSSLAKLFLIVLAVGVPLLAIHAFLRFNTARIQVADDHVRYHRGWPQRFPRDLPFVLIDQVYVRRGLAGRLFGGGTLAMRLTTGDRVYVPDLKDPEAACSELKLALGKG